MREVGQCDDCNYGVRTHDYLAVTIVRENKNNSWKGLLEEEETPEWQILTYSEDDEIVHSFNRGAQAI